jgi:hypothetical protein
MDDPVMGKRPEDEPRSLNAFDEQRRSGSDQGLPGPLRYESPRDRAMREPRLNVLGMTFACGIGFAVAAAGVLFFSAYLYMGVNTNFLGHNPSMGHTSLRYCAAVYFFLFSGAMFGVVRLSRAPGWRKVGRWWTLGMLLGAGAGMLVEGICFAAT